MVGRLAALGTGGLPRGKTSERERWLAEMVRGGWSQARKRGLQEWGGLAAIRGSAGWVAEARR